MSQRIDTHAPEPSRVNPAVRGLRLGLALGLVLAACLSLTPAALAKFSAKSLRLGSSSGAVDYLFTAGNTVVEQGMVDRHRYYRFDVYDPSGTVRHSSACRPSSANGSVSSNYTLQSIDPDSNTTAWRFRLREFSNSSSCANSNSAQNDTSLYFDVASATSYASSALNTPAAAFAAGTTAYVRVAGAGRVSTSATNAAQPAGSWSTSWILPSGATACANTTGADLPGSLADGRLPAGTTQIAPAKPNLQYAPSSGSGVDVWNQQASYGGPCPAFANGNQGQWSLLVRRDSTHFVTLPAFTVETVAPDTTLTSGPSNVTSSNSASFTFTSSESGSTFQCSLDGAAPTPCSSPQTYTALGDGGHTFNVAAVDAAGNVDPTPATTSWTVNTTTPNVDITSPSPGSYTNNTTPTFTGTAETKPGDGNVTVNLYAGTAASGTALQTLSANVQSGGSWSVPATVLAEGVYTVQAQQTNTAAQTTGYSEHETFTVDTTPPTVTLYTPVSGTHTNDTMPEITGTAGTASFDVPTVTVTVSGVGSPVQVTTSVSPSGNWEVDLPSALADGNYTVQASQTDLAGNTGSDSSSLTIDTTPPQTFLDAGPTGVTSSTTATFSFHSTDAVSQTGSTFICELDGGNWAPCSSPQTYYNLAGGSHTFAVEAVDGAGNVDNTGQTDSWTINTSLPAITLVSPAEGAATNDTTPTFSGTAGTNPGDSSSLKVLIYSNSDLTGSPVQTLNATAAGDGSWSVSPSTPLANGIYVAYAQQAGTAGTATSDAHTFTVNTQPPTTTIDVGPPGDAGSGAASFSFSSSEPGSSFQCQLDGGGWTTCTSPQDYSGLDNESHTFQVRAIDPAGNVGAAAIQTWSVNTNLPALTLSAPSDASFTNNPTQAIAGVGGTASGDASTVTINLYSGTTIAGTPLQTIITSVDSGSGAWSTHPAWLTDGTYTVYAQQVGSAGTAYTQASTFTIDTTPPTTTITSEPQGATGNTSARFTFTSSKPGSTFQCQLDSSAWAACTSPQSYSSLSTGAHTFTVRATDPAGNVDPNPPQATWTIDPTVPVTLTSPADGTSTNDNTPTFAGAASAANGPVSLEIDDSGGNTVEVLSASAGAAWSATASPPLADGTYTAFASQLGSDGVTTDYSAPIGFTVDTTPPTVTLTQAPSGTIGSQQPTFGGGAGAASGDQGTVTVNLYSGSAASGPPAQTRSVTPSRGAWSATAAPLANGTYTVRAQQSDAAGNTGYSSTDTFTVDATPPTTTITDGPPASTTATDASFSFTSSKPGSTFACQLDGGAWSACSSPQSYGPLAPGAHTFSVRATDSVGNVDPSPPSQTWTVLAAGTPPSGGPAPSGNPSPPGGSQPTALQLLLRASGTQHLRRRGAIHLILTARCSATCTLLLAGRVTSTRRSKRGHRARSRTLLSPRVPLTRVLGGKLVKLGITVPARWRKALGAALATRRQLTLTVTGLATAPGMKAGTAHVTIHLVV